MSGHVEWRMRKASGQVFGPDSLDTLRSWACDGRVAPDDEVREGAGPWRRAGNVPDLGMEWLIELPGGELYGPVPLAAFLDMLREGTLGPDLKVRRRDDADFRRLGDVAVEGELKPEPPMARAQEPEPPPPPEPEPLPILETAPVPSPSDPVSSSPPPEEPAREPAVSELAVSVPSVPPGIEHAPVVGTAMTPAPPAPTSSSTLEISVPFEGTLAREMSVPPGVDSDGAVAVVDVSDAVPEDSGPHAAVEPEIATRSSPPSSRITPPDEARMLSELQSALGVGRRFRVFDRLRQGRSG